MHRIIIYKHSGKIPEEVMSSENLEEKVWTPKWNKLKPIYYPKKYYIYWIFHYLNIFHNKNYQAFQLYQNNTLVSSLLLVPSYYRWPFMQKNDVQLTYVVTMKNHRGKGMAFLNILFCLKSLSKSKIGAIWYVTDSDNIASISLAEKAGFIKQGYGLKKKYFTGYTKLWLNNNEIF